MLTAELVFNSSSFKCDLAIRIIPYFRSSYNIQFWLQGIPALRSALFSSRLLLISLTNFQTVPHFNEPKFNLILTALEEPPKNKQTKGDTNSYLCNPARIAGSFCFFKGPKLYTLPPSLSTDAFSASTRDSIIETCTSYSYRAAGRL